MENKPQLIVMLTHNDRTVMNAAEIFEKCKNSKAQFWGFKEEPLPLDEMKTLFAEIKSCNKTTALEVVAYTEEECLKGAEMAAECNCDILMGTVFFDSVNDYCKKHNMKYMPYVGTITERPSVLQGSADEMIKEAKEYISKGAFGINLLGYRYTGDAVDLIEKVINGVDAPVCVAGSVDSYKRLDEIKSSSPWAFTIGGAFFENKFDGEFADQVDKVCDYINR